MAGRAGPIHRNNKKRGSKVFIYHFNRMIRNRVLWLIFAIVVGATFLAVPSCFTGDSSGREYAGTIGKDKVPQSEYSLASMFVDRFMRMDDLAPAATETQIWAHIAAIRTARKMGITVTDEELRSILRSEQAFQTAGRFDRDLYTRLIEQNLGIPTASYERLLADQIIMGKLMAAVGAGHAASPMEIDDEIAARTDEITMQYATVSNAFATAEIELGDDALLSYYEEHKDGYALPDRVAVRFATIPVTNYISGIVIEDADIEDYYESNPSLYSRQGTNGVETIPLDEVRDSIYRELAMQEAAGVALTNLNDFIESLATNDLETFSWRCEARGMKKPADTPLFALDAPFIRGVEREALADFRETALDLDASRDDARYGVAQGKEFVYLLRATTNDVAHTQPFEEVKDAIRPLAVAAERQKKFHAFADEKAAALKAAVEGGATFADAAAAQSLGVSTSITFTVENLGPSAFDNARAIVPEVARLKTGAISKPIDIYNGAVLAYVSARKAGDAIAAETHREQIRSMMSVQAGAAAFSDWLVWNLERTGFTSVRAASLAAAAADEPEDDE